MAGYDGGRPYSPNPVPYTAEEIPRYLAAELQRISNIMKDSGAMTWGGIYETGLCYDKGTVVLDDKWTMVATEDTCDKPAPVPIGTPAWTLPTTPAWVDLQIQANTLYTGQRYLYDAPIYLDSIRVWVPVVSASVYYQCLVVTDPAGATPTVVVLQDWSNSLVQGWNTIISGSRPIGAGVEFEVLLATQNRSGQTTFVGDWDYQTPNNEGVPLAGEIIHATKAQQYIRINYIDDAAGDRTVELQQLVQGDLLEGANMSWTVQSNTDAGTYAQIGVTPNIQGTAGLATFTFTHYAAQPVTYSTISDNWVSVPEISGIIQGDVTPLAIDQNAYGTDIQWQDASVSEDWDVVSPP